MGHQYHPIRKEKMDERTLLEKELASLEYDINKLENSIEPLRIRVQTINSRLQELEYGLQIGQKITYRGQTGLLEKFHEFWPVMRPYKKDGSLSSKLVNCYNFREDNDL